VPGNISNFNEGIFSEKEQVHDVEITDLQNRMGTVEGTANEVRGAMWAFGIFWFLGLGSIKMFWKGILRVALNEIDPRFFGTRVPIRGMGATPSKVRKPSI
jgi:hypothetical protein